MKYNHVDEILEELINNPVEKNGHLYHPIPFPEFTALKTSSNEQEAYKKLDLICKAVSCYFQKGIEKITVLDIGANAGFYTFSLAKRGARVTAFEPHPRYGPIGVFIAKEKELPVRWYRTTFCRETVKQEYFDLTLMLSVFQWIAGGGELMECAINELRYISGISETLIFEIGFNKGNSSIKTSKVNHYAELVKLLKENTRFKYYKLLGSTKPWGSGIRYLIFCSDSKKWDDSGLIKLLRMIRL